MRKLLVIVGLFVCSLTINAQDYRREGNTFISTKTTKSKGETKKTKYTWQEPDGKKYPVYMSSGGSCFILRTSKKTGKEYRKYLGKEVSAEMREGMTNISIPNNKYRGK